MKATWQAFEHYVTHALGLDATIHSGSKFFDQGDAVTRTRNSPFPLFADAKFTEAASFWLKLKDLQQWGERATEVGKRLVVPLRFWPRGAVRPSDYVVLSLDDFIELMELASPKDKGLWCPVHRGFHPSPVCDSEEA